MKHDPVINVILHCIFKIRVFEKYSSRLANKLVYSMVLLTIISLYIDRHLPKIYDNNFRIS